MAGCPCGDSCSCNPCTCGTQKSMKNAESSYQTESFQENDGCKCGPNCSCNPCTCK